MMTTNLAKLKGKPPSAAASLDIIAENARPGDASIKPIQFRVPESVFVEFSEQAGREFGYNKGSKSNLFLKMWKAYQVERKKA
jgi:hypothetical protein